MDANRCIVFHSCGNTCMFVREPSPNERVGLFYWFDGDINAGDPNARWVFIDWADDLWVSCAAIVIGQVLDGTARIMIGVPDSLVWPEPLGIDAILAEISTLQ